MAVTRVGFGGPIAAIATAQTFVPSAGRTVIVPQESRVSIVPYDPRTGDEVT